MALTAFESGAGSLVISEMLSQENETDWIFDRRIANQYGKQLFVDSKTAGCHIHIGNMPFRIKTQGFFFMNLLVVMWIKSGITGKQQSKCFCI